MEKLLVGFLLALLIAVILMYAKAELAASGVSDAPPALGLLNSDLDPWQAP